MLHIIFLYHYMTMCGGGCCLSCLDLKPANCLIDCSGCVKIADMNMSKVNKGKDMVSRVGTPYYMSPEIFNGERYTITSDMWSLGCIIYHLVALRRPFEASRSVHVK